MTNKEAINIINNKLNELVPIWFSIGDMKGGAK